ncbi:aminotransferase [Daldinia loculata]|uniref:aminotransferase n=1 Tax=Daldinia loculata TaxID=103429 RepID=UPI0020C30844|nr:aminotransferase [Daldinia loculata]KAI1650188.1 aminotransferase [Daldinia loculata]
MDDFRIFTSIRYDPALLKVPELGYVNTGWNQNSSPFYMLDLHRDRMLRAAVYWQWSAAVAVVSGEEGLRNLQRFLQNITSGVGNGPHRIMLSLAQNGTLDYQISPLPETHLNNLYPEYLPRLDREDLPEGGDGKVPIKDPVYDIFLDSQKTSKSEFTHYKTTFRDMYNDARRRAQINLGDRKEVLLVNDDRHIMEGSISTPYFWRDGKWVTPPIPTQYRASEGSGGNNGTTRRWALERNLVVEQVVPADSLVDGEECWISNGLRGFIFGTVKLQ